MRNILISVALTAMLFTSAAGADIPDEKIYVTGASHIDLAWKWTYREGERVCRDTFRSVLNIMERYDEPGKENPVYYSQSSAQAYAWMEKDHPAIFERIRKRVADGQWELVGGMWCEPDALIPSGESFVRHFLYGQWYFQDKFGQMATIGWLPDSFGFNANLPQFMSKSGIDRFFFYKLKWNDTHTPDYNLFWWQSPDSSKVLTHLAFAHYNNPTSLLLIRGALDDKRAYEPEQDSIFYPLGFGDHGGGIGLNNFVRMHGLRESGYDIVFGRAQDYFDSIDLEKVDTIIDDELYFENHRAAATSRAEHKKNIRELEYMLQNAEIFSSLAYLLGRPYAAQGLDEQWQRVLRDHFHDTMAGTCLDIVYTEEIPENLGHVRQACDEALDDSLRYIAGEVDTSGASSEQVVMVFNPNGFATSFPVAVAAGPEERAVFDDEGQEIPSQMSLDESELFFMADSIPAWGWRAYSIAQGESGAGSKFDADNRHMENEHLIVAFDEQGHIVSLYSKDLDYELIAEGERGNMLQLYDDRPGTFDSWDIGFDKYEQEPTLVDEAESVQLVENGPARQVIEVLRSGQVESYVQRIILWAGADYLDFETEIIDWGNPARRFLKVAFPTSIVNERKELRHNIPYGHLKRVLDGHRADFEFNGHKWIDLTETTNERAAPRVGMALIAREKYGYDIANDGPGQGLSDGKCNIMRLSLLKSGTSPTCKLIDFGGPVTDRGDFMAHYRLVPHGGDTPVQEIYQLGEAFANVALIQETTVHDGSLDSSGKLLSVAVEGGAVIPTTLKRPYRDPQDRDLILRLVEIAGRNSTVSLSDSRWEVEAAHQTDILERAIGGRLRAQYDFAMHVGHFAVETMQVSFSDDPSSGGQADDDSDDEGDPASDSDDEDDEGACCG